MSSRVIGSVEAPETGTRMVIGYRDDGPAGGVISIGMGHQLAPEPAAFMTLAPDEAQELIGWLQLAIRNCQGN